ncbi:hypothetical protein SUDANB121_05904 (plasmid) [Nocardiopsis dassonvillei]|uniref:hypothetical protein n=1 Tax=Nocardiopsis dassonvillei TaxID=2014 RepID=UPI003F543E7C
MARKSKKNPPAPAPAGPVPGSASLPPEVLAALGHPVKQPETRTLRHEGVGAIIAAGWRLAFRPGEGSLRRHMAAQFYPWKVGGVVLAAGVVAARAAEVSATHGLMLALATGAGAWAALRVLSTVKARRWKATKLASEWAEIDPAHARVCSWAAGLWLVAVILISPATLTAWWWAGLVGLLALLALGSRFWAHHRVPRVLAVAEEELAPPPPPGEHPIARQWRTTVASSQGPLPGTKLTDLTEQPYGVRGRLHLVRARQTITSVRAAIGYIATGLGVSEADILIEHTEPTEEHPKPDSSILDIKIVTVGLLSKKVPLEAGRLDISDDGEVHIRLGPYADGDGQARYRLYTADSMWSGFVAGSTGSGKSGLIDNLALGAWETKNTVVFYLDPKNGGSSPRIFDRAHWAVPNDPATWDRLLSGLVELVEARGLENSARLKTSGFTPSFARPGVLVIVDECHAVINADNAYRWGRIAREGRAAGVALVLASQIYGLDSFGGSDAVRANVTAGNTVALRVSRNQASMIADITLDPSALPKITGVGLTAEGRDVAFRAAWAPNEVTAALMDAALEGAPQELDALAAGALDAGSGGLYRRRHEIAAQQVADAEERLAAYETGRTPGAREATAPQVALANFVNPSLDNLPTSIDPALLTDRDLGLGILAEAGRDPHERLLARWSGAAKRVLELLIECGALRRGEIEKRVREAEECSRATVSRALDDLAEAGVIEALPNRGGWQLAA